jgi:hypothetical protein
MQPYSLPEDNTTESQVQFDFTKQDITDDQHLIAMERMDLDEGHHQQSQDLSEQAPSMFDEQAALDRT